MFTRPRLLNGVSKLERALMAKPLWPPPLSGHQPPTKRSQLPASPASLPRRESQGGGGCSPHRDIPSVCRQLAPFRCPGVSPRLSASHSPSTSSSQQLLKPEKGRKWKPGVSRCSVSATGQPAQSGPGRPPRKSQAEKP